MNSKFYTYDRESLILPQSIEDWLPEGHLAKFIVSIVDQLDLSELEKMYSAKGGKAYPVQLMLALIFYAYITAFPLMALPLAMLSSKFPMKPHLILKREKPFYNDYINSYIK